VKERRVGNEREEEEEEEKEEEDEEEEGKEEERERRASTVNCDSVERASDALHFIGITSIVEHILPFLHTRLLALKSSLLSPRSIDCITRFSPRIGIMNIPWFLFFFSRIIRGCVTVRGLSVNLTIVDFCER